MNAEPLVSVGLLEGPEARLSLHGPWELAEGGAPESPELLLRPGCGDISLRPLAPDATFTLGDMPFGIGFHWERRADMAFRGVVRILDRGAAGLIVINDIGVEDYLASVISSEMNAAASDALLRAHAVISRSWLLRNMRSGHGGGGEGDGADDRREGPDEVVRWYDHSSHTLYDVCADDHCQRYQGWTRTPRPSALAAVEATRGLVLVDADTGRPADARFSKCCGGAMETFENCWQPAPKSYLRPGLDRPDAAAAPLPDLTREEAARDWIMSTPPAWCHTHNRRALAQVLNPYDCETKDFFRWRVSYNAADMADVLRRRSGIDFGRILALTPLQRGPSGRITRLRVTGHKRTVIVGKELEIRKWLSESHLLSSAFVVEPWDDDKVGGVVAPSGWTLHGAGWGHGVGLCQIGAALMADAGHGHEAILAHYYPGALLKRLW